MDSIGLSQACAWQFEVLFTKPKVRLLSTIIDRLTGRRSKASDCSNFYTKQKNTGMVSPSGAPVRNNSSLNYSI